jgi:hypothetical protein
MFRDDAVANDQHRCARFALIVCKQRCQRPGRRRRNQRRTGENGKQEREDTFHSHAETVIENAVNARRILVWGGGGLLVVLAAAYAYLISQKPLLELGVGYGARVACACRFIGNRTLDDCRKDFEPGMEAIRLSENVAEQSVTASVPLLTSRTVRFDPDLGCQPEPFVP